MPKNFDDIVPLSNTPGPERRSIRDIPIPEGRRRVVAPPPPLSTMQKSAPMMERPIEDRPVVDEPLTERRSSSYRDFVMPKALSGGGYSSRLKILGLIVLAIIIVFGALSIVSGATLTYTPKTLDISFANDSYTAYKTADSSSGNLLFSVVQLSDDKSMTVPASGSTQVSTKASGTIVVYNDYSASPQKLIANTRFATTDGKIYRTPKSITIPGKSTQGGKDVPGSIEVTVTADQPGADYNIPLSDFTVPGLKGDPQYSSVYARSKTSMTGGLVGTSASVSDSDLASAKTSLDAGLKSDLVAKAEAQVPADYILLPDLSIVDYSALPNGTSTATTVIINEHADFAGLMFKKTDLAAYLAAQKGEQATGTVTISDISNLHAQFGNVGSDLLHADTIDFSLNGSATLQWVTDEKALAQDLAGKRKSDLSSLLKNYPGIEDAKAVVKPFWKTSFPSDQNKIKIVKQ